ncbi:MAG: outer membrane lipoprotein LolB [Betaproteobacteria bacterium RIFCSPLOWO2_02_FULL_65_20]|nr:MAG: outer membrane lipoprotein LolB [Betaproteobacteria bacterium RIFCSPLOWO2_02_FULL_65_20]
MHRIGSVTVLLSALLAGCASLPVERGAGIARDGFELAGRVAVRYGSDGASGRIAWRHSPAADDLFITSALGQGIARITRRDGEIKLVTADQKEYGASDAESLTERVLGWRLPLTGLPDWVQGRADPARPAQFTRDAQSRLSELRQDDWRVEYQEYDGARPSKLRISRADLEIRLVVDQWVAP